MSIQSNKFSIGDVVKMKGSKDTNRKEGVVQFITCQGATKTGGKICERKTCNHNPKDRVWVKWPNEDLYSYTLAELQIDGDAEDAVLQEAEEMLNSKDPTLQQQAAKSLQQIIRARKLREMDEHTNHEHETEQSEPSSALEMFKADASKAAYRVATTQINTGVRNTIVKLLQQKGSSNAQIESVIGFLDTELGAGLLSLLSGFGLQYAPMVSKDPRAQRLATEFRVGGMAQVGNELFDKFLGQFLPVITQALASLPEEATETKTNSTQTSKPKAKVSKRQHSKSVRSAPEAQEDHSIDVELEDFSQTEDAQLLQNEVGKEARRTSNGQ